MRMRMSLRKLMPMHVQDHMMRPVRAGGKRPE
jgi:hypothetical protein